MAEKTRYSDAELEEFRAIIDVYKRQSQRTMRNIEPESHDVRRPYSELS